MKLITNREKDHMDSLEAGLIDEKKSYYGDTQQMEKSENFKGCIFFSKVTFYFLMVLFLIFIGYVGVITLTPMAKSPKFLDIDSPRENENFDSVRAEEVLSSSTPEDTMTSTQENGDITTNTPNYETSNPTYNNDPENDAEGEIPWWGDDYPKWSALITTEKSDTSNAQTTQSGFSVTESELPVHYTSIPDAKKTTDTDPKNPIKFSEKITTPFVDSDVSYYSYDSYYDYSESAETTTATPEKITTSTEQVIQKKEFTDFQVTPTQTFKELDELNTEEEELLKTIQKTLLTQSELADIGYPWDLVSSPGMDDTVISVKKSTPSYAKSFTQEQIVQGTEFSTMATIDKTEETKVQKDDDFDIESDRAYEDLMDLILKDTGKTHFQVETTPEPLIIKTGKWSGSSDYRSAEDEYDTYTVRVPDELIADTELTKTITESVGPANKIMMKTGGSTEPTTVPEDVPVVSGGGWREWRDAPQTEGDRKFLDWLNGKIEYLISKEDEISTTSSSSLDAKKKPNDAAPVTTPKTSTKKVNCDCIQEPVFPTYPRGRVPFISIMRVRTICTCGKNLPITTENSKPEEKLSAVDDRRKNNSDSDEGKPTYIDLPEYGDITTRSPVSRN